MADSQVAVSGHSEFKILRMYAIVVYSMHTDILTHVFNHIQINITSIMFMITSLEASDLQRYSRYLSLGPFCLKPDSL